MTDAQKIDSLQKQLDWMVIENEMLRRAYEGAQWPITFTNTQNTYPVSVMESGAIVFRICN